jgi:hypothetical protein
MKSEYERDHDRDYRKHEPPPPSPFLPGTRIQYAWDSTSLGWFKTCPRLYQYSMIEGWRAKQPSIHLHFGLLYHAALELYDRLKTKGATHDDALVAVVQQTLKDSWPWPFEEGGPPSVAAKTRPNLIRSIIWYLDEFEHDPCETVVLQNGKPAVELSFRLELDYGPTGRLGAQPYVLSGHIDRLVILNDGTYVMDRKTTASMPGSFYFDKYSPDNQMSLYSLASKIVYSTPVKGVIIDVAQVAITFTRFARGFTYRGEDQLTEWLDDARYWFALAYRYAEAGHWPMNDKACDMYGGCAFRRVCSKAPEMRPLFLESDFRREPWNPLEVR